MNVAIPFIQYRRPNGQALITTIDRPGNIGVKALLIVSKGYRLEIEELSTGDVSMTIHDPVEEIDVAIEVCPNGPEVPAAVDRLIEGFKP